MFSNCKDPASCFLGTSGRQCYQAGSKAPPQRRRREPFEKKLCSIVSFAMQNQVLRFSYPAFFDGEDVIANAEWLAEIMHVKTGTVERNFRDHEFRSRKLEVSGTFVRGWKAYTHVPRRFIPENVAAGKTNLLVWKPASKRRAGSEVQPIETHFHSAQNELSELDEIDFFNIKEIEYQEMDLPAFEETPITGMTYQDSYDNYPSDDNSPVNNPFDHHPMYQNPYE